MQRLLVDQAQITKAQIEDLAAPDLKDGQARLKIQRFALTANNVTYAATGFVIGYWSFFPSGVAGKGLVPVWGTAEVVESRSDAVKVGQKLYGFYPLATELVITPKVEQGGVIVDDAAHRRDLPAVYNRYTPSRAQDIDLDRKRALLQPLLATSYLIYDWLRDNECFGAEQIVIGSASSKTGLGLCKYLAEDKDRSYRIVGLTSARNRDFVRQLGACDQVLTYDAIAELPQVPSVYVDMAGNAEVKVQLHAHLADLLRHSSAVGISHWDQFRNDLTLAGPKPQFFFAPAQIAKRRDDWGPGEIEKRITAAWKRLTEDAGDWLDVKVHDGIASAPAIYLELAEGRASPRDGHVIEMSG